MLKQLNTCFQISAQQQHHGLAGEFGQAGPAFGLQNCTEPEELWCYVLCLKTEHVAECSRGREHMLACARSAFWALRLDARSRAVPQA